MAVSAALPEAHSEKANVVAIDSSSKSPCGLSGVAEVFLPRPTPDRCLDRSFGGLAFPGDRRLPSPTRYSSAPRLYLRMRPAFEPVFFGRDGYLETFPPQGALCFREQRFASPVAFNLHEFFGGVVLPHPVYPTFLPAPNNLMMFGNDAKPYCLNDSAELCASGDFERVVGGRGVPQECQKEEDSNEKPKKPLGPLTFRRFRPTMRGKSTPHSSDSSERTGHLQQAGSFFCPLFGHFGDFGLFRRVGKRKTCRVGARKPSKDLKKQNPRIVQCEGRSVAAVDCNLGSAEAFPPKERTSERLRRAEP